MAPDAEVCHAPHGRAARSGSARPVSQPVRGRLAIGLGRRDRTERSIRITATSDPLRDAGARVTGIWMLGPWYPITRGYDPPPHTRLSAERFRGYFRRMPERPAAAGLVGYFVSVVPAPSGQISPSATMALATRMNPAMLAPLT
jgi:hypothetical protein